MFTEASKRSVKAGHLLTAFEVRVVPAALYQSLMMSVSRNN